MQTQQQNNEPLNSQEEFITSNDLFSAEHEVYQSPVSADEFSPTTNGSLLNLNSVASISSSASKNDSIVKRTIEDNLRHGQMTINNHKTLDDITMDKIFQPNKNLIRTLFPGKEDRLLRDKRIEMVTSAADLRIKIHKLYSEYMLDDVRDTLNAQLTCIKGTLRSGIAVFLKDKYIDLCKSVFISQKHLIQLMNEKFEIAKTISSPTMKRAYQTEIEIEERRSLEWIRGLVMNFENIMHENIKKLDA
jgi:hypothetical protein